MDDTNQTKRCIHGTRRTLDGSGSGGSILASKYSNHPPVHVDTVRVATRGRIIRSGSRFLELFGTKQWHTGCPSRAWVASLEIDRPGRNERKRLVMRSLKVTMSAFGLVAGVIVGLVWIVAASQPVRINYAFVVGRWEPGFWWYVREYLPLASPVLGALIGWIVAFFLVRSGWRLTRGN